MGPLHDRCQGRGEGTFCENQICPRQPGFADPAPFRVGPGGTCAARGGWPLSVRPLLPFPAHGQVPLLVPLGHDKRAQPVTRRPIAVPWRTPRQCGLPLLPPVMLMDRVPPGAFRPEGTENPGVGSSILPLSTISFSGLPQNLSRSARRAPHVGAILSAWPSDAADHEDGRQVEVRGHPIVVHPAVEPHPRSDRALISSP
jgi:hypothetical protein